jgi:hypothetical protein
MPVPQAKLKTPAWRKEAGNKELRSDEIGLDWNCEMLIKAGPSRCCIVVEGEWCRLGIGKDASGSARRSPNDCVGGQDCFRCVLILRFSYP